MMTNEGITMDGGMVWYLDIGANNHMFRHKNLFIDIQDRKDVHVSLGDSIKVPIKG